MRTKKHNIRNGAVIIESLLVFPVILLLIIGIMQLAFTYSDSLHLKYAAYQISRESFFVANKDDIIEYQLTKDEVMPSAVIENGYSFEKNGLIYNILDVGYRSRVIFPGQPHLNSQYFL